MNAKIVLPSILWMTGSECSQWSGVLPAPLLYRRCLFTQPLAVASTRLRRRFLSRWPIVPCPEMYISVLRHHLRRLCAHPPVFSAYLDQEVSSRSSLPRWNVAYVVLCFHYRRKYYAGGMRIFPTLGGVDINARIPHLYTRLLHFRTIGD